MRALLIDDQTFILAAFQAELMALDSRVVLVSVESARGARQALAGAEPFDFVLLDLQLACENSFDLLAELCHSFPSTPIIAVSGLAANADVVRAIYLGAVAFVPRHAGGEALLAALRTVASGRIYVPPLIFAAGRCPAPAIELAEQPAVDVRTDRRTRSARETASFSSLRLTPRQTDVLTLMLQGQSNKLIARSLNLSVETIKDHVTAVLRTLKVKSRTQAVLAVSEGYRSAGNWREHGAAVSMRQLDRAA